MPKQQPVEARLYAVLAERGMADACPRRKGPSLPAALLDLFSKMNHQQIELILTLLGDYIYHPINRNYESLSIAFENAFMQSPSTISRAYAFPIKHWGQISKGTPKSGDAMIYATKNLNMSEFEEPLKSMQLIARDYYTLFSESKKKDNQVYIFVDDFIGTGDTAIRTVNEFVDEFDVDYRDIYVIAMVAMDFGVLRLQNLGINVGINLVARKGISDSDMTLEAKEQATRTMEDIESDIQVLQKYKFGYKQSESLVSIDRKAPNNTFPFFWYDGGVKRVPPFVR